MTDAIREWYASAPKTWRACWCGCTEGTRYAHPDRHGVPLSLVVCLACTTVRVECYLSDDAIEDFYATKYRAMYDHDGPDALFANQRKAGEGLRKLLGIGALDCVVDYGSGAGGLLAAFPDATRRIGIEPGEYASHGESACPMFIVDDSDHINDGVADYVFAIHTIEHMTSLQWALRDHMRMMKPDGRLVVEVPSLAMAGKSYGTLSNYLQVPHYWQFTHDTLIAAARSVGLEPTRSAPFAIVEFKRATAGASESDQALIQGGAQCMGQS